ESLTKGSIALPLLACSLSVKRDGPPRGPVPARPRPTATSRSALRSRTACSGRYSNSCGSLTVHRHRTPTWSPPTDLTKLYKGGKETTTRGGPPLPSHSSLARLHPDSNAAEAGSHSSRPR